MERRDAMNIREIIQNSLDYIENNLKAELTVTELCNMAGYSYVHYCRLFQSFIGMPVGEYINRRKLLHAVFDISNGNSKIDVALNYGFETYAGFYKAFKREFNCSPSEFTKSYKGSKPYRVNILQEENIMISKSKIQKLLFEWNLQSETVSNCFNENTGKQNDNAYYVGDDHIIKFTANLGCIKRNISISEALIKADVPTFEIVKTVKGDDYLKYGELYFIITKRIKGRQLKCEDIFDNTELAICIGMHIAKLHNALKTFDEGDYNNINIYSETIHSALPKVKSFMSLSDEFMDDYVNAFGLVYDNLPKQIIHRDINPSNMIFDNGDFKGFVDFDLSEINIRVFDICYCATSILSECFSNENIEKDIWFEILDNLVLGYEKINPLTDDEKIALPYVIYAIQIFCIAYFSNFDKYKALAKTNIDIFEWIINNI